MNLTPARRTRRLPLSTLTSIACMVVCVGACAGTVAWGGGNPGIKDGTISSADIKNSTITGADVKDESLTGADVHNGSLKAADLGSGVADFTTGLTVGTANGGNLVNPGVTTMASTVLAAGSYYADAVVTVHNSDASASGVSCELDSGATQVDTIYTSGYTNLAANGVPGATADVRQDRVITLAAPTTVNLRCYSQNVNEWWSSARLTALRLGSGTATGTFLQVV